MKPVFSVLIKLDNFIIGAFTGKSCRNASRTFVMSVSAFENNRMGFHEIPYWVTSLLKRIDKLHFCLKSDNTDAHYMEAYMRFCAHMERNSPLNS
jgi:hypothetical protein